MLSTTRSVEHQMIQWQWIMNGRECGRKWSSPNWRYCSGIFLDRLRKTMNSLSQDSRYPDWDSTQTPPEHKSETILIDPVCSVVHVHQYKDILIQTTEYKCCLFQADTLLDSIMDQEKGPKVIPHIDTISSVSCSKMWYTDHTNMFQFADHTTATQKAKQFFIELTSTAKLV